MDFSLTQINGTHYVGLTEDTNLTPWALENTSIIHEAQIRDLPEVQELNCHDTVIDVGAFIGDTALIFGARGARVFGFEPFFDAYCAAVINTYPHPNIKMFNSALGDGREFCFSQETLNGEGNLGTRSISEDQGYKTVTLDSLWYLWKDGVSFIKLDCEGMEYAILKESRHTLEKWKPKLLIEIFPEMLAKHGAKKEDIYHFLYEHRYVFSEVIGNSLEPRWDILAVPQ